MADTEFEEFRKNFESFPSHLKAPSPFYSIVPNLDDEDYPSSKSDSSDQDDDTPVEKRKAGAPSSITNSPTHHQNKNSSTHNNCTTILSGSTQNIKNISLNNSSCNHKQQIVGLSQKSSDEDEICDGLRSQTANTLNLSNNLHHGSSIIIPSHAIHLERTNSLPFIPGQMERRRRKLPEIPKNKKSSILQLYGQTSLADELIGTQQQRFQNSNSCNQRSILALKCGYLLDEDSSPDSDRLHSLGDVDSGHSTAHSPTDFKSMSPQLAHSPSQSPFPPPFGGIPFSQLEMLEATHRGLHKFIPRHHDEIDLEIGDPLYVQKEADDLWCEGVNLRTGRQGIFPSAYAVDLDYNDFDPTAQKVKKERYLLGYLGSVETMAHKGTGVVCQAVRKIVGEYGDSPNGQLCILEISDQGLRMVDRSAVQSKEKKKPCIDYFYSLKNVSFCAFHPRDHRYIGFITKHPTIQRFACHVFKGHESTRPVAEAVGRAFQHFYQKFIETAYPIEDIYIE